jgi:hypothetical protein
MYGERPDADGALFFFQMKNEKKHGSTGSHYVFLSRSVTTEDAGNFGSARVFHECGEGRMKEFFGGEHETTGEDP